MDWTPGGMSTTSKTDAAVVAASASAAAGWESSDLCFC